MDVELLIRRDTRPELGALILEPPGTAQRGQVIVLVIPLVLLAAPSPTVNSNVVAVVMDFGTRSHHRVLVTCVPAVHGATGLDVLTAATVKVNVAKPTQDANWPGFICSIGKVPNLSTSCVANSPAKTGTWAYWHGTGHSWSYSTYGAGTRPASASTVEGWRFEVPRSATDRLLAPRGSSTASEVCAHQSAAAASAGAISTSSSSRSTIVGLGLAGVIAAGAAIVVRVRRRA